MGDSYVAECVGTSHARCMHAHMHVHVMCMQTCKYGCTYRCTCKYSTNAAGEWSGGKHNGAGSYYFKSGKVFQGSYRDGQPTSAPPLARPLLTPCLPLAHPLLAPCSLLAYP